MRLGAKTLLIPGLMLFACVCITNAIAAGDDSYANVIVRDATNPELIFWSAYVPDWTTYAAISGSNLVVRREKDTGSGLVPATNVTFQNIKSAIWSPLVETVPNQVTFEKSLFHLQSPSPDTALPALTSPQGGTYGRTIQIILESREGATIYFRKNGGAWQTYNPDSTVLYFHRTGTLEACASYMGFKGDTTTETYTIQQAYDADADFDGTPDFVEDEKGLNPLDGDIDTDDDGWRDLDELIRGTDPLDDESYPADSDAPTEAEKDMGTYGDGWADFDETFRQTDPNDPTSEPVVTGFEIPEAIIPVAVSEPALRTPTGAESSPLTAVLLNGNTSASAALNDPSLRTAVDEPLIIRYIDGDDPEVVLLSYAERQTFDPHIEGDETTTADEWIADYRSALQLSLFEIRDTLTLDANSTAATLAFCRYLEKALSLSAPCIISESSGAPSRSDIHTLEISINLDDVMEHITDNISETALPGLVRSYIDWAQSEDIHGNIIDHLAWVLHGWNPGDAPDSVSAKSPYKTTTIDFDAIRAEIDELLDAAPTRTITFMGELVQDSRGFLSVTEDGTLYGFDAAGTVLSLGTVIAVTGQTIVPSPYEDVVWVKPSSIETIFDIQLGDETDSDGNGIDDQWESFYFPDRVVLASGDPDGDGYSNIDEYNGFSNPLDQLSTPVENTPVMDWLLR